MLLRKLIPIFLLCTASALANERIQGDCSNPGQQVIVPSAGGQSQTNTGVSTYWTQIFPSCVITVYLAGTNTIATIYSDNVGTALGNPFTSDSTGHWFFYASNGTYDVNRSGGGGTGFPSPSTYGGMLTYDSAAGVEYFIDQYASGSSTGGIQEAYTACQNNALQNPTGCRLSLATDETISAGGVVAVLQGRPLYMDLHGHTIKLACNSGACLTFAANVAGGSANISLEHGQFLYTGSSGGSVSQGILVSGTDYMAVRDVTFGPQSGPHATISNWMLLSNAEDNIFENVNFINGQTPIILGTGNAGTTPGSLTTFYRCTFNGNAQPIQIVSATGTVQFLFDDWEVNSSQTLVKIDNSSGQNIGMIRFQDNFFGSNGDGTSSTSLFVINSAALQANSQIMFDHNDYVAGIQGVNATVYKFTGSGTPNFFFEHKRNLYNGPFGALFSGWVSGQSNVSENEQCSTWSCVDHGGDVLINSPSFGSGSVVVNSYFGDSLATTASGFLRLASGDTLNFRNQAGSGDIVGFSKNSSDQILIGATGTPTLTYRALDSLQTTVTGAKFAFSNFGVTGSLVIGNNAKDQGGLITFTSGTASANPSVTLTFQDGTFTNRPTCQAWFQDNTSPTEVTAFMQGTNATQMTAEWIGSPSITGDTIQLQWICRSGG